MGEKRRRSEVEDESEQEKRMKIENVENSEKKSKKDKKKKSKKNKESSTSIFDEITDMTIVNEEVLERLKNYLHDRIDDESSRELVRSSASSVPFLSSLLCSYAATRTTIDQSIFHCLSILDTKFKVNLSALSPLIFDVRARENYDKLKKLGRFLHVKLTPDQVIEWLDPTQLWTTVIIGDKKISIDNEKNGKLYDMKYILRLLLTIVHPASELSCRLFVEKNCLALAFASSSSSDEEIRRLGLLLLQRYLSLLMELKTDEFVEKSLFVYLIRLYKNSLESEVPRVPHVITHFFARVSKLLLNASHPVYSPILAFLTLKPTIEMNQVPELFKLLISSSTEHFEDEQIWLLNLISSSIIDPLDYQVLQNRSGLRLILSLFSSCLSRMNTRKGCLAVIKSVVSIPAGAYDCLLRHNLAGWIAHTIQRESISRWETIYLGEIYYILLENARVYGRGKSGATVCHTIARITTPTVGRLLNGKEAVSYKHMKDAEECVAKEWIVEEKKEE